VAPSPAASSPAATPSPPAASAQPAYLDDRSTGASVIGSLFNAINRKEYVRAYSYWRPGPQAHLPPYPEFEQGYQDTASVDLTIGTVSGDAGAGQLYFSVPAKLVSHHTDGTVQTFVGCYVLHLANPAIQGVPPFQPLAIESASVEVVASAAAANARLATICQTLGASTNPLPASPTPEPNDVGPDRYLDDRSDGIQVLRSLFNAVNRHEYVRAYSYWQPDAPQLPPFAQFEQGYQDTQETGVVAGDVQTDVGAGQIHQRVPVVLVAKMTNGQIKSFVGCYTLHLAQPAIQGAPPFQPLAIESAQIQDAASPADAAGQLLGACQSS
jgi:hypothetical protein